MALGEAAGTAAALAVKNAVPVQEISIDSIQGLLLDNGASLVYLKDLTPASPDFKMAQIMALKGYIPGWEARLDEEASAEDLTLFRSLSGKVPPAALKSRKEILQYLFDNL